jgi:hypothetical protein
MKKITLLVLFVTAFTFYLRAQDSLQTFVGKYKFPEGSMVTDVTIALENNVLMLNSERGNAQLDRIASDTFAITAFNGTVVFKRNEAKKVTGITIDVMGITLEGNKEEKEHNDGSPIAPLPFNSTTFPVKYLLARGAFALMD